MTEIEFPPGVDVDRVLAPLNSAAWEHSPGYRRAVTENDPVAFALSYLPHHLSSPLTGGRMSFSPMHIHMAKIGMSWLTDEPHRDAVIAPRSAGKPVAETALVLMGDGSRKRLGDVAVDDYVITHTGAARRVLAVHEQGELPVVEIRTRRGRVVRAALDHPFLTDAGYVEAGRLEPGDMLVTVPRPEIVTGDYASAAEFALAGYFIGDGAAGDTYAKRPYGERSPNGSMSTITVADPVELEHVREIADEMGFTVTGPHGPHGYYLGNGCRAWLRRSGISGTSSYTKRIPQWVYRAPRRRVAAFLAAYFACDGTVGPDGRNVEYYSVSRDLLSDTQHLLHRLGIRSTLRPKRGTYQGRPHHSWRLRVENTATFTAEIGPHLRSAKLDRLDAGKHRGRFTDSDHVVSVTAMPPEPCRCLTVDVDHTFTVEDLVVHNSVWGFLILPLWALAHGHRSYVVAFADSAGQAEGHLANLRRELETNELLLTDYPELAPAVGGGARNNARDLVLAGGGAMSARGMDSRSLGARSGADRPDLLIGDDLEPMSKYSAQVRDDRLRVLIDGVLPMGDRASVLLLGTVVRYGSIMHTLAQHARGRETGEGWPVTEGFRPRYFRPILGHGDNERSCWPARWSLDELRAKRDAGGSSWWLSFTNDPPRPGEAGAGWTPEMFQHGGADVERWTVVVDVAPTSKATSDQTAVAVLGPDVSGRHLVVAECRGVRAQPGEIRDLVHRLAREYAAREVHIETNQGGDGWRRMLSPMPQGTRLVPFHTTTNKRARILDLVDLYGRGGVIHARRLGELERQALAWPDVVHDDLVDVVALGAERMASQLVRM